MISGPFAAALDGWTAAVLALHDAEIDGREPDGLLADVGEIAGRISEMTAAVAEDGALQDYIAAHWVDLEQGLVDGDNPFWLELEMERHLTPTIRTIVIFWGRPFRAEGWIQQWREVGGIIHPIENPDGTRQVFIGAGPEPGQPLDRPSAAELRQVLRDLLTDCCGRIEQIEAALFAEGPVKEEAWPGSLQARAGEGSSHA